MPRCSRFRYGNQAACLPPRSIPTAMTTAKRIRCIADAPVRPSVGNLQENGSLLLPDELADGVTVGDRLGEHPPILWVDGLGDAINPQYRRSEENTSELQSQPKLV